MNGNPNGHEIAEQLMAPDDRRQAAGHLAVSPELHRSVDVVRQAVNDGRPP